MRRAVVLAVIPLAFLVFGAGPSAAHAGYESSDPADGAVLDTAPTAVSITFTEPPDLALSSVEVLDAGGSDVAVGPPVSAGARSLSVPLEEGLPDGAYTVSWRVVSFTDGHPSSGVFAFGIGAPPPPGPGADTGSGVTPSALSIGAKAAFYAGAMLLLAVAVVGVGLFAGRPSSLPLLALGAAVLMLLGGALMLLAEQRTLAVSTGELVRSSTGQPYLWLVAAGVAGVVFTAVGLAHPRRPGILWGAGVAAAAAMFVRATSGHAAAATPAWVQEGLQWFHFLAAGIWIGGLVLIVVLVGSSPEPPVAAAKRFSSLAAVMVGVVVLTGILRSREELGGFGWFLDATDSSYGTALLFKVVVALVVIGFGAVNRFRTLPRLDRTATPLRRIVSVEVIAAAGVLLLTGTLTGLDPEAVRSEPVSRAPTAVTTEGTDFATTTRVRLTVTPGTPGTNRFDARVLDHDTGTPRPADQVTLRLGSVTTPGVPVTSVELEAAGNTWTARSGALALAGTWSVEALVRTGGDVVEIAMTLSTRQDGAVQTSRDQQGLPTLVTTAFHDGVEIETFVDPGTAGANQVHVTVFAPDGTGLPTRRIVVVAAPEQGPPQRAPQTVFGEGHVVADTQLDAGTWTFDVVATAEDGQVYQATWTETIETPP